MTSPNLFVVGAPRCGTTTLHELLGAHPDIYMSENKEPWFYSFDDESKPFTGPGDGQGVRDRATYQELFTGAGSAAVVGESSTLYLSSELAPQAIKEDVPDARIVAILRHPVDRAFSNYTQHRWQGREPLSFEAAIAEGASRVASGWAPFWDYRAMSRYGLQLQRWYAAFPADHIKVLVFEDLAADPSAVMSDVYGFLGVDSGFEPLDRGAVNAAGEPRWSRLHAFLRGSSRTKRLLRFATPARSRALVRAAIDRTNRQKVEAPSDAIAAELASGYVDELAEAEQLIGRSLPAWLG